MAAGILPAPGTAMGPCVPGCAHVDCAETRRMAEAACVWCGLAIGYDRRFYADGPSEELAHASCVEMAAEVRLKERLDVRRERAMLRLQARTQGGL